MGTVCLDACRLRRTKVIIVVTSDKVYENDSQELPFVRTALGGHDPIQLKAATEIIVSSYRRSYFAEKVFRLSQRAVVMLLVVGFSEDRLIPDIVRAVLRGKAKS